MNLVVRFLAENQDRLGLARSGLDRTVSSLFVTPRWATSRHVVALLLARGGDPVLVAKLPRLRTDGEGLAREAAILELIEAARPDGFRGIPRVVAHELVGSWPLLVETALPGRPIGSTVRRRDHARYVASTIDLLVGLPRSDATLADAYERLLEQPLRRFARSFGDASEEADLAERTLDFLEVLRPAVNPLVLEHGDLSHPNLIWLDGGGIGVVDWELAELEGLPAHDLCFFLAFLAFATDRTRTTESRLRAFSQAFLDPGAWARPALRHYTRRIGLDTALLTPLFVACWARYTTRLLGRVGGDDDVATGAASRLHAYPYFALWRHAIAHAPSISWTA